MILCLARERTLAEEGRMTVGWVKSSPPHTHTQILEQVQRPRGRDKTGLLQDWEEGPARLNAGSRRK